LRGLLVKVRGGGALEVKVYLSPGILEAAGRARPHRDLAEVVLSLQLAPPRQRRSTRLAASTQTAAHQPVLTGQPAIRGDHRAQIRVALSYR
jgi:hypothetical protein